MMRTLTTILLAFILAFATACSGGDGDGTKDGVCANSADCPDNFLCLEEVCTEIGCTESSDCALGYFCDATYTCTTGCSEDVDCIAGETCNTNSNTCEAYGCRDTQLDCAYGEFCDQTTGECYSDDRDHCGSCDVFSNNSCGNGAECFAFGGDSCNSANDCDPGYSCDGNFTGIPGQICHIDFCEVECNVNEEEACPRGFTCLAAGPTGFCSADCAFMTENGFLE
ncbi:MAG: hypothetical protein ACI8RZ_006449 [Myxococcota bacterium]|jgi:hypothetical protein